VEVLLDAAIDDALAEAAAYVRTLAREISEVLGDVGVSKSMADLLAATRRCWDWARLVKEKPTAADVRALAVAATALEPVLRRTLFPEGPAFTVVDKHWPSVHLLGAEYLRLCRRVRLAARGNPVVPPRTAQRAAGWLRALHGFVVREIRLHASVAPALLRPLAQLAKANGYSDARRAALLAAERVSDWLFRAPRPREKSAPLAELRQATRQRRRAKVSAAARGTLLIWQGKVHVVLRAEFFNDVSAVAAALDTDPWFALGAGGALEPAWAACRLHHRCRLIFVGESSCESVGSVLRLLHQPIQHLTSSQVADAALLQRSGFQGTGSAKDEALVEAVAEELRTSSRYRILPTPRSGAPPAAPRAEAIARAAAPRIPSGVAFVGAGAQARRAAIRLRAKRSRADALPTAIEAGLRQGRGTDGAWAGAGPPGRNPGRTAEPGNLRAGVRPGGWMVFGPGPRAGTGRVAVC